ncbi:recombinase family protein [Agrobacterium rhizogenes]|uniref:recombinase family protein n=1 Tax=Rhizobium rhizogenes TaxID=359 RepID=UPI00115C618A|nr:recombinase family protein [Rhizobium rhizogenes]NTG39380.1 recombinase family protein [Rhizobium rhizogenes]NTG58631.1 recombinase family protein [Rhizobium rhizogenes]NTI07170.1 recombinase family protein [Rhizobium rhizogenes]NTI13987.1 recombinase family protein [Rhizobium rhizogenes]TRB15347.1 recombinase family protein [Rhizobium rhizogenes]
MWQIFSYIRVSAKGQISEDAAHEIEAAGYVIEPRNVIFELTPASTPLALRKGFISLLADMKAGDILVVPRLDSLGRDVIDITTALAKLGNAGVRVYCIAIGKVDLADPQGNSEIRVINVIAEFERKLRSERMRAGLKEAKLKGTVLGRPPSLKSEASKEILDALSAGVSLTEIARRHNTSRQTIMRVRDRHIGMDELKTRVRKNLRSNMAKVSNDNPK